MNILKTILIVSSLLMAAAPVAAQTGALLPPPGPYQQLTIQIPVPAHPLPQWKNIMPVPYWMQSRPMPPAQMPAVGNPNTVQNPVYPQAQQQQSQRQRSPNWGGNWGRVPNVQLQGMGQYRQGNNQNFGPNYGTPNGYYNSMPQFFPNVPWGGFPGPSNQIYGYQPARPAPVWPQQ